MPVSPSAISTMSVESSVVVRNDSGAIINTTPPVISGVLLRIYYMGQSTMTSRTLTSNRIVI